MTMTPPNHSVPRWLDNWFGLSARNSTIAKELRAGAATFLSLSYIFVLAPTLLEGLGLDARGSLIAVILLSVLATWAAGTFAKVPFAFAPGLEMLLYVTYVAIPVLLLAPANALASVFVSGLLISIFAIGNVTHKIHKLLPEHFQHAVAISMGVFLVLVAAQIDGLVSYPKGWINVHSSLGPHWILGACGVALALILDAVGIPAPILISVLIIAILAGPVASPYNVLGQLLLPRRWFHQALSLNSSTTQLSLSLGSTFTLLVLSLWGSYSKVVNVWETALDKENTKWVAVGERDFKKLWLVEGVSAIASGAAGITNVTMFVESGAGISLGGKTGIASLATGALMILAGALVPYIRYIDPVAGVGALCYIGILFFPKPQNLKHVSAVEWGIIALMIIIIVLWMSLTSAFLFGIIAFWLARRLKNASEDLSIGG